MRVIIEIGHPAHVHHFKHLYWDMSEHGHQLLFVAKQKECSLDLLEAYDLPYRTIGKAKKGVLNKALGLIIYSWRLFRIARVFKPDIFVSRVSPNSSFVSTALGKPHICFADTETSKGFDWIAMPGIDHILTSTSYLRDHGKKQLRYPGYHELAYLHPFRFRPDPRVLGLIGVNQGEKYAVVRFVSWNAHHDIGQHGISLINKIKLVSTLAEHMKVFISSESELPGELSDYRFNTKPEYMLDILHFAHLFVGESATMASECAILGTPAVFINNAVLGCIEDQKSYGMVFQYPETPEGQEAMLQKSITLASHDDLTTEFNDNRERMLSAKIDVTCFMVWFIENYPASVTSLQGGEDVFAPFTSKLVDTR